MKKMVYTNKIDDEIIFHENNMLALYLEKAKKYMRIGSIDGEADYYPLSTAWMVSSIFRKFFKLNAELYVNTDDADADLNDFLSQLIKYSR